MKSKPFRPKLFYSLAVFSSVIATMALSNGFTFAGLPLLVCALCLVIPDAEIKRFSAGRFGGQFDSASKARWTLLIYALVASVACFIASLITKPTPFPFG